MDAPVMLTIAFVNAKPGTGKTTCAVWLAHAYHESGRPVLLVDADPGGSAAEWADLAGGFPFRVAWLARRDLDRRLSSYTRPGNVVIIDCGQLEDHAGIARAALRLADEVIVPCAPTTVEVSRTVPMLAEVRAANDGRAEAARCCVLLNRTVAHANSTGAAREALTGSGFAVLGMTVPRLEVYAQSFAGPIDSAGPVWQVIAGELAARADLAEVAR
jgi:chromosome partitioning protein